MQNSTSSVIGRFFGVKFTYNLRRYGQSRSGKVIGENGVENRNMRQQGPPQGMPPGGPGGMRGGQGGPGGMGGGMRGGGGGFGGGGGRF